METNLVVESSGFLGLGMGVVFLFIGIVIGIIICKTNIMPNVMKNIYPDVKPEVEPEEKSVLNSVQDQDNQKRVVAAITAAIKYHREG
jgi:sodium pump decarboxylase gamma subunit